jgi:predicted metalloprotease with PDZ domain
MLPVLPIVACVGLALGAVPCPGAAPPPTSVEYTLTVDSGRTAFAVEMRIHGAPDTLRLGMAAHPEYDERFWRYVRDVRVERGGRDVPVVRTDSSVWRAVGAGGEATVRYRVEPPPVQDGHGSWIVSLRPGGGLVGGPGSFMYLVDRPSAPARLTVRLPREWSAAAGMASSAPGRYTARDFAELMDSPVLVGPLRRWRFAVAGVPHEVAYLPAATPQAMDSVALVSSLRALAREAHAVVGSFPYRRFTFLLEEGAGGGLEHATSVNLGVVNRPGPTELSDFVGDAAHEYFHAWNEVYLRPRGWGGLSLRASPPTREKWWMEGVTMYYAEMLPRRAGLPVEGTRLERLQTAIARYLDNPSNAIASPEQASLWSDDPQGAHGDSMPDVFLQGKLVGALLDLTVRRESGGRRSLDDVMRTLYRSAGGPGGYTGADVERAMATACGCDAAPFFDAYVHAAHPLPFAEVLSAAGLGLSVAEVPVRGEGGSPAPDTRVWARTEAGDPHPRLLITHPRSAWAAAGLRTDDRIVAWNGTPVEGTRDFRSRLRTARAGDTVSIEYRRAGRDGRATVVLSGYTEHQVRIAPLPGATPLQLAIRRAAMLDGGEARN